MSLEVRLEVSRSRSLEAWEQVGLVIGESGSK